MKANCGHFVLVASFVSICNVAAQNVRLTFSTAYPFESDAIYVNCNKTGYTWPNVAGFTFWAVNSVQTHYFELTRNCSSGAFTLRNSTITGLTFYTASPYFLWSNVTTADGNKTYTCSLRACATPSVFENSNTADLTVMQPVRAPVWLSPSESVIQVYENQLSRINFTCNAASLKADESLTMCLNYVNTSGTQRSCHNSSVIGSTSVSAIVSSVFARNAAASSYFNCYTANRLNPVPSYASGRTLQVNYLTDEMMFNLGTLPSGMTLSSLNKTDYELRVTQISGYTFKLQCTANGVPDPVVTISRVTGLSSSEYTIVGSSFSCPYVYMTTGSQFTVHCQASYYYSSVGSKTVTGSLLVRYAASSRSLSSLPLLALLLALSFLKKLY